jgi:hypothetical protein
VSHPHLAPLLVGTLAILALAVYLTSEMPAPGLLGAAHAAIEDAERLRGCVLCHSEDGLAAGCLACHGEIATQLREGKGYHAHLLRGRAPECASCHPDHQGRGFDIVPALDREFDHPHVEFHLGGAHGKLACEECHDRPFGRRARTFLGLSQDCISCHENVHKEDRFLSCTGCHNQEEWKGATLFVHDKLPLVNGHSGVACGKCHLLEAEVAPLDYGGVRGTRCEDCHVNPHRVAWDGDCESCHARDATPWNAAAAKIDAALHLRTGFPLSPPHDEPECARCHAEGLPYAERFPDPPRPPESCAVCHEDVHKGQFAGKGCLDCHEQDRWKPARIDHSSFPLRFAHEKVECASCHKEGAFRGTARTCAGCHEDVHKGQFGKRSCDACHTEKAFLPSLYDVPRHERFALAGAHRAVSCRGCHADGRFAGTAHSCKACHEDPHGGQFARETRKGDCTACHAADASTFAIRPFDHRTYPLEGAHAEAACARCHSERKGVRVYRETPRACAACHTDVHRGQFGEARCDRCHLSNALWTAEGFDHAKTRFPLDRAHAPVSCERCHPAVRQPDGASLVQYRPLATECESCHGIKK